MQLHDLPAGSRMAASTQPNASRYQPIRSHAPVLGFIPPARCDALASKQLCTPPTCNRTPAVVYQHAATFQLASGRAPEGKQAHAPPASGWAQATCQPAPAMQLATSRLTRLRAPTITQYAPTSDSPIRTPPMNEALSPPASRQLSYGLPRVPPQGAMMEGDGRCTPGQAAAQQLPSAPPQLPLHPARPRRPAHVQPVPR